MRAEPKKGLSIQKRARFLSRMFFRPKQGTQRETHERRRDERPLSHAGDLCGAPDDDPDDADALDAQQEHEEEPAPAAQPEASQWHHGNRRIRAHMRIKHNPRESPDQPDRPWGVTPC